MHNGVWCKTAKDCKEVRGKILGIVGYGHIGSQLSVLAEAIGMHVLFFDTQQVMAHGLARPVGSLEELLGSSDFVTLHVPELPSTVGMINAETIAAMRRGSYLINASRGSVVDIEALRAALDSGHLEGAALDVYPTEPESNGRFCTGLENCRNLIMTPHIGGSTAEAQEAIGVEVK